MAAIRKTTRTASRKTNAKRQTSVDAIALLKKDHETVRGLLTRLESSSDRNGNARTQLLEQIEMEVRIHTQLEEEVFYPAYGDAASSRKDLQLYYESIEKHHVVDLVMPEIREIDVRDETFPAKAKVLKGLIEDHAREEERVMFPKARKLFGASGLRELGQQMLTRKQELQTEMERSVSGRRGRRAA